MAIKRLLKPLGSRRKQPEAGQAVQDLLQQDIAAIRERFDTAFYLKRYPDVGAAGIDPIEHYCRDGWREFRDPAMDFSTQYYLRANPDVAQSGVNPYAHFILQGEAEGRKAMAPLVETDEERTARLRLEHEKSVIAEAFNAEFYVQRYEEIAQLGVDPLDHYCRDGWREGRDPNDRFSTAYYLYAHPDVEAAGINPFWHYIMTGESEGRACMPENDDWMVTPEDPRAAAERALVAEHFDADFYLLHYPQVAEAGVDPVDHYLKFGAAEGHDPSPDFSTRYYLEMNPDLAGSGVNPFWHYLSSGKAEGRDPRHPGGYRVAELIALEPLERNVKRWRRKMAPRKLLDGEALVAAILGDAEGAELIFSLGHDQYRQVSGGVQLCIQREETLAVEAGGIYLNLHPWQPLPRLAHAEEDPDPVMVLVRNGTEIGKARMSDLIAATGALRGRIAGAKVVVHHLLGHLPEQVAELIVAAGERACWLWLHDFFSICPSYTLQRNTVSYCGAPDVSSNACTLCRFGVERVAHNERMQRFFDAVQVHVLSPSEVTAELWQARSGLRAASLEVVPHMALRWGKRAEPFPEDKTPITIGFLGTPAPHKGWNVFARLVRSLAASPTYRFVYLGQREMPISGVEHVDVHVTADTPDAMIDAVREAGVDLVLHWASWPETFSLSTYEAFAGGAYVLTNPISGNVAATVARLKRGAILEDEAALHDFVTGAKGAKLVEKLRRERAEKAVKHTLSGMGFEVWGRKKKGRKA